MTVTKDGGFIRFSVLGTIPFKELENGSYFALSIQGRLYPYVKLRSRKAQSLYGVCGSDSDITPLPGATVYVITLGDNHEGTQYMELTPVSPVIPECEPDGFIVAESLG